MFVFTQRKHHLHVHAFSLVKFTPFHKLLTLLTKERLNLLQKPQSNQIATIRTFKYF